MRQAPDLIEALVKIFPIIKRLFKTLQLFAYEYEWPPNRHTAVMEIGTLKLLQLT